MRSCDRHGDGERSGSAYLSRMGVSGQMVSARCQCWLHGVLDSQFEVEGGCKREARCADVLLDYSSQPAKYKLQRKDNSLLSAQVDEGGKGSRNWSAISQNLGTSIT
jgi:hypothetical protein